MEQIYASWVERFLLSFLIGFPMDLMGFPGQKSAHYSTFVMDLWSY